MPASRIGCSMSSRSQRGVRRDMGRFLFYRCPPRSEARGRGTMRSMVEGTAREVGASRNDDGQGLLADIGATPPPPSRRSPSPRAGRKAELEDLVAAVDQEGIAGVVAAGVRGQVDGDAAEILGLAPAAGGHAADDLGGEGVVAL